MKTIYKLYAIICFIFLFSSCQCVEGTGEMITKSKPLPDLSGLKVCVPADIDIHQSDSNYFCINAPEDVLSQLIFRLSDGTFEVLSHRCLCENENRVKITLYAKEINQVFAKNGASIKSIDCLSNLDKLKIIIEDEAFVNLELNSKSIYVHEKGNGTLILKGDADRLEVFSNGTGELKTFGLNVKHVGISSKGSSAFYVNPKKLMDVNLQGDGIVYYKGDPTINSSITGLGNITKYK